MKMKLIMESFRENVKEAYYGSIPGEPETPAEYGGALDAAKAQQHLSDEIDDLVRLGKLDINDLSVETVRANQEIPWDKFQAIDDEVLGDIIRDYQQRKKFYREGLNLTETTRGDEYQGMDQVKYQLGLMLGQMASDPAAAKWTQRLDKILVLMQNLAEGRIVHAGAVKDITDGINNLAGTLRKLDPSAVQSDQAAELRAALIALDSSVGEVFGDSLENAVAPRPKLYEECGMTDEPMPMPGPPPEGAGAIEPAFDDHEGRMAKSQLFKMAKYSTELMNLLDDQDQLPAWVQAKVTKAADYIGAVKNYLEYERAAPSSPATMQENKISKRRLLEIIKEELK